MKIKTVDFKVQIESVYKEGDLFIVDHFFKDITGDVRFVSNKELEEEVVARLTEKELGPGNKVIAMGGGFTATIADMVAEKLKVKWVYYPTTLVGCTCTSFMQKPSQVYLDKNLLKTLPFEHLINGFSLQALMHLNTEKRYEFFKTNFYNKDELENVIKSTNKFSTDEYKGIGMDFGMEIMKLNKDILPYTAAIQGAIFSLIISLKSGVISEDLFSDIVGNCFSKFTGDFEYGPTKLVEGMGEQIRIILIKNFGEYETREFTRDELLTLIKED